MSQGVYQIYEGLAVEAPLKARIGQMRALPGVAIAATSALLCLWVLYGKPNAAPPALPLAARPANSTPDTTAANPFGALSDSAGLLRLESVTPQELGRFGSLSSAPLSAPVALADALGHFSLNGPYGDLGDLRGSVSSGSFALDAPNFGEVAPVEPPEVATSAPVNPPLPPRRPSDLGSEPSTSTQTAALPAPDARPSGPDVPGFFAKLFNGAGSGTSANPVAGPNRAVAYAAPAETTSLARTAPNNSILRSFTPSAPPGALARYDKYTAVYDIEARMVYLPDGTKIEAHSGYGDLKDDPRHVDVHARGATPPLTYELTLRESLFHGVQALRLKPLGAGDPFGRTGLLAHPYMLGPDGDSNGCVSVKDYDAFLQAYQSGLFKKLVVVAKLD